MHHIYLNEFYQVAIKEKLYSNKPNLKFHLNYIFKDIELVNKNVLDVGGGKGLLTFYAAIVGATKAVCLEPECDGSNAGMIHEFNRIKSSLSNKLPIEHLPQTLQEYIDNTADDMFDVVVLHNSINHLNENACINFLTSPESYDIYKKIFQKVFNKMKAGGKLIIADCSCTNFYNTIGIKSPITPTIEWHKHQKPATWISMLQEVGFKNPSITWTTPNTFKKLGKLMMGNAFVSYFTKSHFKFTMVK